VCDKVLLLVGIVSNYRSTVVGCGLFYHVCKSKVQEYIPPKGGLTQAEKWGVPSPVGLEFPLARWRVAL
jgi:hypothetical protein